MSRSVDLFIDADLSLDELAERRGPPARLAARRRGRRPRLAAHATATSRPSLAEHPYGDDGDLFFSRYRFALSARLPNDVRPHDTAEAACSAGSPSRSSGARAGRSCSSTTSSTATARVGAGRRPPAPEPVVGARRVEQGDGARA